MCAREINYERISIRSLIILTMLQISSRLITILILWELWQEKAKGYRALRRRKKEINYRQKRSTELWKISWPRILSRRYQRDNPAISTVEPRNRDESRKREKDVLVAIAFMTTTRRMTA